jgi:hypothetical protein
MPFTNTSCHPECRKGVIRIPDLCSEEKPNVVKVLRYSNTKGIFPVFLGRIHRAERYDDCNPIRDRSSSLGVFYILANSRVFSHFRLVGENMIIGAKENISEPVKRETPFTPTTVQDLELFLALHFDRLEIFLI